MDGNKRPNPRLGDTRNENDKKETKNFQEYKLEIKFPPISSPAETMATKDEDLFSHDVIKLLASNLHNYQFHRLCQELHLTVREILNLLKIDWRNNSQERVTQMLNIWFQMTANKDRKTILVQALNSINRNDLAKEIRQGNVQISTSKENKFVSSEHKQQRLTLEKEKDFITEDIINCLAENLERWQIISLSRNLGLREKEINKIRETNLMKNKKEGISQMLKTWKEFSNISYTEHGLFEALISIHQEKLAKKLFPGIDQKSPKIDSTIISKTVTKDDKDFQEYKLEIKFPPISSPAETMATKDEDLFSHDVIKLLASNLHNYQFHRLCQELHLTVREILNLLKIDWRNNSQERVTQMLNIWFQMTANKDRKTILVQALNSINRNDLAKEIRQGNVQISTSKENKFVSSEHKQQRLTLEKEKDFITEDIINCLAENLERWQIISLSRNLGLREKEINKIRETNLMKNKKEGISQMLKTWKEFSNISYTEHGLFEALISIHQEKLAKKLFPGIDQKSPKIDSTIISKTVTKDDKATESEIISEQRLRKLSVKFNEKQSAILYRKLGLKPEEIKDVMKEHSHKSHPERVYQVLMKWKQKCATFAADEILERALLSIDRKDLINEIFPELKILKELANRLTKKDANALFKKLGITNEKMQEEGVWFLDTPNKYHLLRKWWQKINKDVWDYILKEALLSINRRDLIKTLFSEIMRNEKEASKQPAITDDESVILRKISENISKEEAAKLFKNLEIKEEEINKEEHLKWFESEDKIYYNVLQTWWINTENTLWESILATALVSINRLDLARTLFPFHDYTAVSSPQNKEINEASVTSSPERITGTDTEKELVSEKILRRLSWKLNTKEISLIYKKLGLEQDIEDVMKELCHKSHEEKVYHFLMNWKLKAIDSNPDEVLARALWSIGRKDLIIEFFPEQKILKLLANQLDKKDAIALFKELGLTDEEMHCTSWDTQKKYQIFRKWWRKVDTNVWDFILVRALLSINRPDLVKSLFPDIQIKNEVETMKPPVVTDKDNTTSTNVMKPFQKI